MLTSYSQALQDIFVLEALNYKCEGTFLEIGANHPIEISNTYVLETQFNQKGIMVEHDPQYLELYKLHRPNSDYVIGDAVTVDYNKVLEKNILMILIIYK